MSRGTPEEMPGDWTPYVSAYLDDELEPAERKAFEEELACNPRLQDELEEMQSMKSLVGNMRLRELPDGAYDHYRERIYNRLERRVGWILLSIGAMVLVGYGLYGLVVFLVTDGELAWWIRAAIGAACLGLAILLVSVIRERVFVWKKDPYREVKR
jgi:anti-sigma factor RsiW